MEEPSSVPEAAATASAPAEVGQGGAADAAANERLSLQVKLAYGMPTFAAAAMGIPVGIHLTKFYSDTVGVALGFIALAQALARALDAITDPLVGWLSDRTNTRWGRRRPWILVGAPVSAIAFVALFAPPDGMAPLSAALWFTAAFTGFYVLNTLYFIPYYGLGAELTPSYHERSSLFAWRDGIMLAGTATAAATPAYLVGWAKAGGATQAAAEREIFFWFAVVSSALLVLLYAWMSYRVPENPAFYTRKPNPLIPGVRRVLRNGPFRILLACYLVSSITAGSIGILMPFYLQYALGIASWVEWMGVALLTAYGAGAATLPFWLWLSKRIGKKPVWILTFVLSMISELTLFVLPSFLQGEGAAPFVIAFFCFGGMSVSAGVFLAPSIQADVIDYDELYTGKRREAQYGALWSIATKFAVIPSASIPLAILASMGFEPNVEQTEALKLAIRALFALAPATFAFLAMLLAFRFPITEPVHRAIRDGIDAHARNDAARDPITGREVLPPDDLGLDEETSWFLDHFSDGELRRALRAGPSARRRLLRDTGVATALSALVCAASSALLVVEVGDLSSKPGVLALVSVLVAGVGLTGVCFHSVRVRAARSIESFPTQEVRAHLEIHQQATR